MKHLWWIIIGIFVLAILLRVYNLQLLPIFNDESTYIRYGMHQLHEPDHNPYSLLIGKEPLLPFLYAFVGSSFNNLLVGARLVTVLFSLITLFGLYLATKGILNPAKPDQDDARRDMVAVFVCLLYAVVPYAVFFDRLALLDSAVGTVAVWSLYLTHRIIKKTTWLNGVLLGVVFGLGMWVKFSSAMYIGLYLLVIAYYSYKNQEKVLKDAILLQLLSPIVLAGVIFIPLESHPYYIEHLQLLAQYTYPITSIFTFPVVVWFTNFLKSFEWLFFYLTPLVLCVALWGVLKDKGKRLILPLAWFILPFLYEVLYAKLFTSRQGFSLIIPLVILAGYGLAFLTAKNKRVAYGVLGIVVISCLYFDSVLLMEPSKFPSLFPGQAKADLDAYVQGFSSGYGVQEAIIYLQLQAKQQPITVIIRNDHGNPEDAIVGYLHYYKNIKVIPLNDPQSQIDEVFKQTDTPVYSVSRGPYYAGLESYFVEQKRFGQRNNDEFVGVQRLEAHL
jgi:hypothetical protein